MSLCSSITCYFSRPSLSPTTKAAAILHSFSLEFSIFDTFRTNSAPRSRLRASSSTLLSVKMEPLKLTYFEVNSWLVEVGGLKILVDPIFVGNLDFGAPWAFDGAKKSLKNFKSLDDHCHLRTVKPLSKRRPDLLVVSPPNAEHLLQPLFTNVTYLEPGQNHEVCGRNGEKVYITATAGPVLGPPWQRPENGYIIYSDKSPFTLYYEPHCVYNLSSLQNYRADVIITPVIKQELPAFTLVSGQEDAVQLARLLKAKNSFQWSCLMFACWSRFLGYRSKFQFRRLPDYCME